MINVETLVKEINEASVARNKDIPMLPIVVMHERSNSELFLNEMRDYLWFSDCDNERILNQERLSSKYSK